MEVGLRLGPPVFVFEDYDRPCEPCSLVIHLKVPQDSRGNEQCADLVYRPELRCHYRSFSS